MRYFQLFSYHVRKVRPFSRLRTLFLRVLGARIGRRTIVPWSCPIDWPQRVKIGAHCEIKERVTFHHDGPWGQEKTINVGDRVFLGVGVEFNICFGIEIGGGSLIGSGCVFVDHDHGTSLGSSIRTQACLGSPIIVGQDCWLGSSCIVLKGVSIGDGAVVGAGSLVTTDIPENEVWAGIPARKLRARL